VLVCGQWLCSVRVLPSESGSRGDLSWHAADRSAVGALPSAPGVDWVVFGLVWGMGGGWDGGACGDT